MSSTERAAEADLQSKSFTQEMSMEVEGTWLRESKVVTTCCAEEGQTLRTDKVHTRWIQSRASGGRVYTVCEVDDCSRAEPVRTVTTSMTKHEVPAFLREWDLKWRRPSIDLDDLIGAGEEAQAGFIFGHLRRGGVIFDGWF